METEVAHRPRGLFLEQAHPASSRLWALNNDRMTIGRDTSSDVFVDDTRVSRHHADLIRHNLDDWSIVDTGSTNGTYVNGARVHERILRPDDRIQVGDIELVLRLPGASPTDRHGPAVRYDVGSRRETSATSPATSPTSIMRTICDISRRAGAGHGSSSSGASCCSSSEAVSPSMTSSPSIALSSILLAPRALIRRSFRRSSFRCSG